VFNRDLAGAAEEVGARALPNKASAVCLPGGFHPRESCMHEVLNEVYLQNLFTDDYNFMR
jgi:hypothetical protein